MSEKCNGNNLKTENIEKFYFYHKKHKIWGVEDKTFFKVWKREKKCTCIFVNKSIKLKINVGYTSLNFFT